MNKLFSGDLSEEVKTSAQLLQEHLEKIKYGLFFRSYFIFLGVFLITLFLIIAVIRLAIKI